MNNPRPEAYVRPLPTIESAPTPGVWRRGIIRDVRDTIADVHILPIAVAEVIAEYAVFATVVVHTNARLGELNGPQFDRFRIYPWNNLQVIDAGIEEQVNAPCMVIEGIHFIVKYTMKIGNTEIPDQMQPRIQVERLLFDLDVGWNQILKGEFQLDVELVRLQVDIIGGLHRAQAAGYAPIHAELARAGWPPLPSFLETHDQAGVDGAERQLHRLTVQETQQEFARLLADETLYEDMPELV